MKYNGWWILCFCLCVEGLSGFGRTISLSPFLQDLGSALSLTVLQISGAYGIANILVGLLLPWVGRLYDRCSAARFLMLFIGLFGGSFIGLSLLQRVPFSQTWYWCALIGGFTGIRLAIQAYALTLRCMVTVWFREQRALATGVTTFVLTLCASEMPRINWRLHCHFPYQTVWFTLGVAWCLLLPWIAALIRKPPYAQQSHSRCVPLNFRHRYLRQWVFWFLMATIGFKSFQMTSFSFHLVPLCQTYGADVGTVTKGLRLTPIVIVLTTFLGGRFFKRLDSFWAVVTFLGLDLIVLGTIPLVAHKPLLILYCCAAGAYWGMRQVVVYMAIPKLFGTECIGAIHGWVSTCLCLGTALGPWFFAKIQALHSYHAALCGCQGIALALLGLCYCLRKRFKSNIE